MKNYIKKIEYCKQQIPKITFNGFSRKYTKLYFVSLKKKIIIK